MASTSGASVPQHTHASDAVQANQDLIDLGSRLPRVTTGVTRSILRFSDRFISFLSERAEREGEQLLLFSCKPDNLAKYLADFLAYLVGLSSEKKGGTAELVARDAESKDTGSASGYLSAATLLDYRKVAARLVRQSSDT